MPPARRYLQLKSHEDVSVKRETVQLSDVELVTDRIIKVDCKLNYIDNRWTDLASGDRIPLQTRM